MSHRGRHKCIDTQEIAHLFSVSGSPLRGDFVVAPGLRHGRARTPRRPPPTREPQEAVNNEGPGRRDLDVPPRNVRVSGRRRGGRSGERGAPGHGEPGPRADLGRRPRSPAARRRFAPLHRPSLRPTSCRPERRLLLEAEGKQSFSFVTGEERAGAVARAVCPSVCSPRSAHEPQKSLPWPARLGGDPFKGSDEKCVPRAPPGVPRADRRLRRCGGGGGSPAAFLPVGPLGHRGEHRLLRHPARPTPEGRGRASPPLSPAGGAPRPGPLKGADLGPVFLGVVSAPPPPDACRPPFVLSARQTPVPSFRLAQPPSPSPLVCSDPYRTPGPSLVRRPPTLSRWSSEAPTS